MPYSVAGKGTVPLVVEYQGQRSAPLAVRVGETGPGAFLNQDGSVNAAANAGARGSVVILYGTGEGQTNPPGRDGRLVGTPLPVPVAGVQVTIGGQRSTFFTLVARRD